MLLLSRVTPDPKNFHWRTMAITEAESFFPRFLYRSKFCETLLLQIIYSNTIQ